MSIAEAALKPGDRVVYSNQGVCRVVDTVALEIAGHSETMLRLAREDDGAIVMIPRGRAEKAGLRRLADEEELAGVFALLSAPVEGPELDWKVRHRTHGEMMAGGSLSSLAQVVKALTTLSELRPLPPKERIVYDNARHLLIAEIAAAAAIPLLCAEDAVDVALFPPGKVRAKPTVLPKSAAFALDDDLSGLDAALGTAGAFGEEELGTEESEEAEEAESEEAEGETEETSEPEEGEDERPAKKARATKASKEKATASAKSKTESAKPKAKGAKTAKPKVKAPKEESQPKAKAKEKPTAKAKETKTAKRALPAAKASSSSKTKAKRKA